MRPPTVAAQADHKDSQTGHHHKAAPAWLHVVVNTHLMQAEGLRAGDVLRVEPVALPQNGQWLVLRFDERLVLRRLETVQGYFRLVPLHQKVQPMEWPVYEPLPLVGVVRQIIRTL